jgi:3-hydroxybutyryl-CoA dehydrogenase
VNALLFGYLNHAVTLLESGHVDRDGLDLAMKVGAGFPMGPLTLLDLIGLDTGVEILDAMYAETGDRLHKAAPLLRRMVAAGLVGRKGGRGFYSADGDQVPAPRVSTGAAGRLGILGPKEATEPLIAALSAAGVDVVSGDEPARFDAVSAILVAPDDVPVMGYAAATEEPSRILGVRWHGNDDALKLIELARTPLTDDAAAAIAREALGALGVPVVECGDRAGFVVDRLLHAYLGDAVRMVEAGYASIDDVDAAMTLGCGYPAGPFATLDAIGLPAVVETLERLYEETREPSFAPPPLLVQLAFAGRSFR